MSKNFSLHRHFKHDITFEPLYGWCKNKKIQNKKINFSKSENLFEAATQIIMCLKFENCALCLKGSPGPAGSAGPEGPAVCLIFSMFK